MSGPPRLLAAVFGLPGAAWPYATAGYVFDGGRLTARQIERIRLAPDKHEFARCRSGTTAYLGSWDWEG